MSTLKKHLAKLRKNESGVALFTVLTVMTLVTIMLMTMLAFIAQARHTQTENYKRKQAFYTARSGMESFVAFMRDPGLKNDVRELFYDMAKGTTVTSDTVDLTDLNMGVYTISITGNTTGTRYEITVEAEYLDKTQVVKAILHESTAPSGTLFDSAIKSSSNAEFGVKAKVVGDVKVWSGATTWEVGNDSNIFGAVYNDGDLKTTAEFKPDISRKNLLILGDVSTANNIVVTANLLPNGQEYVNILGKLSSTGGHVTIGTSANRIPTFFSDLNTVGGGIDVWGDTVCEAHNPIALGGSAGTKGTIVTGSNDLHFHGDLYLGGIIDFNDGPNTKLTVDGKIYVKSIVYPDASTGTKGTIDFSGTESITINTTDADGNVTSKVYRDMASMVADGVLTTTASFPTRPASQKADEIFSFALDGSDMSGDIIGNGYGILGDAEISVEDGEVELTENVPVVGTYGSYKSITNQTGQCIDLSVLTGSYGSGGTYTGIYDMNRSKDNALVIDITDNTTTDPVYIQMPAGCNNSELSNILVHNETERFIYFVFPEGTSKYEKLQIYDYDTFKAIQAGKTIDVNGVHIGDDSYYRPVQSRNYYVIPKDATVTFDTGCYLEGAIMAPNANIKINNSGVDVKFFEDGTKQVFNIGAGIYNLIETSSNNPYILYREPISNGGDSPFPSFDGNMSLLFTN